MVFAPNPHRYPLWLLATMTTAMGMILIAIFYLSSLGPGFDWMVISEGSRRLLRGEPVYIFFQEHFGYYYPPWLTVLLVPLSVIPLNLGWAIMNTLSIGTIVILGLRYDLNPIKIMLVLFSPALFYNFIQGQLDAIVLLGVLLPRAWWLVVAPLKPQSSLGLAIGVLTRPNIWWRAALIGGIVFGLSLLFFGIWPLAVLDQTRAITRSNHNVWTGMWPLSLIFGVGISCAAYNQDDERWFLASSPFLMPYATLASFSGVTLAAASALKTWQLALVIGTWWVVLVL